MLKRRGRGRMRRGTSGCKRFLGAALALIPAAGLYAGDVSPPSIPIPQTISPEARAYYGNLKPRQSGEVDVQNPKALAFMRQFLGKIFLANVEKLGVEFDLRPARIDAVEAYWVDTVSRHDDKVVIYLHGGGYILGSARTNLALPVRISQSTGIPVLSVEYRLAPEHPFPAALNDAVGAYRWLLLNGYEAADIGVFGDSAGGGLALALALQARIDGLPQPAAIAVLSPATDRTGRGDTQATLGEFDIILGRRTSPTVDVYAGDFPLTDPRLSPVYGDLSDFPPLLVQVGTRERLLSDAVRLAHAARRAGVDVTLDVWEGMWHVWQDDPNIPEARQAAQEIGEFFIRHLGVNGDL